MFRTKKGSLNRLRVRDFFKLLVVLFLFFSIPEKLEAKTEYQSLNEAKEIYCQKGLNKSEEIIFEKPKNTFIELFVSVYNIQDDRFKKIYKGEGFTYGFGLSKKLYNLNQHNFYVCFDFKFYSKKGKSTYSNDDTKLILRPISLGGTYMFISERIIPFAEIGADYYWYKEESIIHTTYGTAWGFYLKGGVIIPLKILKSLKGKLYLRYSKAKTTENDLEVDLGGIEYGIGIMYEFNIF